MFFFFNVTVYSKFHCLLRQLQKVVNIQHTQVWHLRSESAVRVELGKIGYDTGTRLKNLHRPLTAGFADMSGTKR